MSDTAGHLYGTTEFGGKFTYGVVFELMHASSGRWTEHVLHAFNFVNGAVPLAGVLFDTAGNLYGTASEGGVGENGTVFELTRDSKGKWMERVLHQFAFSTGSGNPNAGLIFDAAGDLYGTTLDDHSSHTGTVFELTRSVGDDNRSLGPMCRGFQISDVISQLYSSAFPKGI